MQNDRRKIFFYYDSVLEFSEKIFHNIDKIVARCFSK